MKVLRAMLVTFVGSVLVAGSAMAALHLRMMDSLPKVDGTLTESPSEVRVWFNQETSLPVSRLGLAGPDGAVEIGSTEQTDDPKSFKAQLAVTLTPGEYTVTWRTAGDDGHVQRGEYAFTMAAVDIR